MRITDNRKQCVLVSASRQFDSEDVPEVLELQKGLDENLASAHTKVKQHTGTGGVQSIGAESLL